MHDFPDPDALASAYALQFLADKVAGVRSRIVYKGIIGRVENRAMVRLLGLPVHPLKKGDLQKYSHVALVDTQPAFENNPFPGERKATLVIDQHTPIVSPSAEIVLIDRNCGATSILLSRAILSLRVPIPERLATALAYGILTDTLNLYRVRGADITRTYLRILPYANMHLLARIQTPTYARRYFKTLSHAIQSARVKDGFVVCHLGKVSNPDMIAEMADFLLTYEDAKWSVATGRFRTRLHVSLRAKKSGYQAATILRACVKRPEDAGGHDKIAGGSIKVSQANNGKWEEAERFLQDNISRHLHLAKGTRFTSAFDSGNGRRRCND
jgi:nanoRNase/pAp phosphatase (c-di-AMP/oligoRNAs hydrolase)